MDRKKLIYIGIILIITVITSITYFSYAFFTNSQEFHGKLNIVAGTLNYKISSNDLNSNNQITLTANQTKEIEIEVKSLNDISSKYELYYTTTNSNINIGYKSTTVDQPTGTINKNQTKKVTIIIRNKTNSNVTVTFGAEGGFINKNLVLSSGKNTTNQLFRVCDTSGNSKNDVSMLLTCAESNKNYTTINQVLSDTTTLQQVINSNQANDYLVLSTNWANAVTANQTAMTYIGSNNYAADILLSNSTWLDAIANSTYFESVLNVKVPTMTSDTTPSGETFAEATTGYPYREPFRAFDGDDTSFWQTGMGDDVSRFNLGYMFTSPVNVKKMLVKSVTLQSGIYDNHILKTYDLYASNDKSNWTLIKSNCSVPKDGSTVVEIITGNNTKYKYWAIGNIKSYADDSRLILVTTLQFYGRSS